MTINSHRLALATEPAGERAARRAWEGKGRDLSILNVADDGRRTLAGIASVALPLAFTFGALLASL